MRETALAGTVDWVLPIHQPTPSATIAASTAVATTSGRGTARAGTTLGSRTRAGDSLSEIGPRVADVAQAAPWILLEAAFEKTPHAFRRRDRQRAPVGLALDDTSQHRGDSLGLERTTTGQHLVQHAPECPRVCPLVHKSALGLLGAHIGGGPENHADTRHRGARDGRRRGRIRPGAVKTGHRRVGELCKAEVQDFHGAVGPDLHVGRLQIAMDDANLVRGVEGVDNLTSNGERLAERQSCRRPRRGLEAGGHRREAIGQRWSFNELEHQCVCPRLPSRRV